MNNERISDKLLNKFNSIDNNLACNPELANEFQFFYIDKKFLYSAKDGQFMRESFRNELYDVNVISPDRGKILDLFSKLEFIANECLRVHFFGLGKKKDFDYLLKYTDFSHRIKTLFECGVICDKPKKQLLNLSYVRNQFAHIWQVTDIEYLQKKLSDKSNFERFKNDLKEVVSHFIEQYQLLLKENEFEKYLDKFTVNGKNS